MDVLSDILDTLKLQGTLYFTTEFRPPWGLRVPLHRRVARHLRNRVVRVQHMGAKSPRGGATSAHLPPAVTTSIKCCMTVR